MTHPIGEFLNNVTIGEAGAKENLLLFPLLSDTDAAPSYLLLDEALEQHVLEVMEATEGGIVNTILVRNTGEQAVLILDGEELVGAKQNRMVNATLLIPPQTKVEVPVSCVERGRWRYNAPQFEQSAVFGYASIRMQKSSQVSDNLKASMSFSADQGAIWEEIDRKHARMGSQSNTDALHDVYRDLGDELERLVEGLEPQPGQTGVSVFINNRFSCLDLFGHSETLRKVWPKLVRSYAMEALELKGQEPAKRKPDPNRILKLACEAECHTYPSVGRGTDVRLRARGIIGAGLVDEATLLHLSLFSNRGEAPRTRMAGPSRRGFAI